MYCISFSQGKQIHTVITEFNENENLVKKWFDSLNHVTTKVIYYSHNLTFDGYILLKNLIDLDKKLKWLCIDYNIYYIKTTYNGIQIELRCSYKILPLSPQTLANHFLENTKYIFPHKILHIDYVKLKHVQLDEHMFNTHAEWLEYIQGGGVTIVQPRTLIQNHCEWNVRLLKNVFTMFCNKFKELGINIKNQIYSASSISLKYYFKNYNQMEKHLPRMIENYIRPSYVGGRCEVFGNATPNEIILHHDYTGMYSQCMLEKYPTGKWTIKHPTTIREVGFYSIQFKSNMDIPILPVKIDKLYFMNGVMSGTYWYEEILLFLECGGEILQIEYAIIFDGYDNILTNFVNTLEKFKSTDTISKHVGKLLINSFYGRLGMGNESSRSIISDLPNHEEYVHFTDDLVIYKKKIKKDSAKNIAVASAITSKARIKLYKGYLAVINAGGRLLYSDTDSIIAAFPKDKSPINSTIGDIKFDGHKNDTEISKAVFISSKTYSVILKDNTEITKIKGIRVNDIKHTELETSFFSGGKITFDSQIVFSKKNYALEIKKISKTIDLNNYHKRIFSKDKTTTTAKTF